MGGSFRILWRFVSVTLLISFFLLILNFYFLGWVFPRKAEHSTHPDAVVRTVAEGLSRRGTAMCWIDAPGLFWRRTMPGPC